MTSAIEVFCGAALPPLDASYWLALASRVAHVGAAAVLIGGLFYLRAVIAGGTASLASDTTAEDSANVYFGDRRRVWALSVMGCTVLLLLSGFYNLVLRIQTYELPPLYHMLFGIKFLLALFIFFAAAIVAGRTAAAQRARAKMLTWLNAALLASVILLVLAAMLGTINKTPKEDAGEATVKVGSTVFSATEA